MADRIHTNTVVQAIAASTDGVKVLLSTSNEGQVLSAKQVLTTIPFSVMRRLDLSGFSDDKLTSIRSLNYAAASKVILNMKERFWETRYGIFGGASISDRMARQTYYPSDHADENTETPAPKSPDLPRGVAGIAMLHRSILKSPNHRAGGPGVLLASYTLGQDATRMAALAPSERESVSMKDISRYHPEIEDPGMVIGSASMAWSTYPWSAGAFSFLWPRQLGRLYQAAIRNENQVYFAGEHCSTDQAWIQGALISALRAVEEIVSAP
jgi:monoamine oxidase